MPRFGGFEEGVLDEVVRLVGAAGEPPGEAVKAQLVGVEQGGQPVPAVVAGVVLVYVV